MRFSTHFPPDTLPPLPTDIPNPAWRRRQAILNRDIFNLYGGRTHFGSHVGPHLWALEATVGTTAGFSPWRYGMRWWDRWRMRAEVPVGAHPWSGDMEAAVGRMCAGEREQACRHRWWYRMWYARSGLQLEEYGEEDHHLANDDFLRGFD